MNEELESHLKFSANKFSEMVEQKAFASGEYMDSVKLVCDENEIDYEAVAQYISSPLLEKLSCEAAKENLLVNDRGIITGTLFA